MEISIKWNICRICLQEEKDSGVDEGCHMRNIHNDIKLPKQIYDCSGVLVDPKDSLPDKICRKCMTLLRYAVTFRNTCRNSDDYLQSVLKKAKSATSLFKLKKQREETLQMVDDVIEVLEEQDLSNSARDDLQEDYNNEKRKRIPTHSSNEELNVTKKSKVFRNLATKVVEKEFDEEAEPAEQKEEFVLLKKSAHTNFEICIENALEPTELNTSSGVALDQTTGKSTDKLLQDLVGETEPQEAVSTENVINNNVEEEEVEQVVQDTAPVYNTSLEIKNESGSQDESECSSTEEDMGLFEEALSDDQEEEEENETDFATTQENSTTTITPNTELCARKETELQEESSQQISNEGGECILPIAESEREFFYLLPVSEANAIKTETFEGDDDLNTTEHTEYIEIDEETKSECDNANTEEEAEDVDEGDEENIEYLIDSADEHLLTALEYKVVSHSEPALADKSIKRERTKRRGTGEIRVYVCDVCGNNFTNRNLLNFHMKIHRNEKNFECELCYKRFNAACNLSAHMRIHTGEKPYECQYCSRRFTDRSTHIKHERIHTNEKPYTCGTCGKAFSLSTSLKAHEKIHTGEKPYRCEPCAKSFKLPHQLKAHLNTHLHKLISVEQ